MYTIRPIQVGGDFFTTVLCAMNEFGRVSICGAISTYNTQDPPKGKYEIRVIQNQTTLTVHDRRSWRSIRVRERHVFYHRAGRTALSLSV